MLPRIRPIIPVGVKPPFDDPEWIFNSLSGPLLQSFDDFATDWVVNSMSAMQCSTARLSTPTRPVALVQWPPTGPALDAAVQSKSTPSDRAESISCGKLKVLMW